MPCRLTSRRNSNHKIDWLFLDLDHLIGGACHTAWNPQREAELFVLGQRQIMRCDCSTQSLTSDQVGLLLSNTVQASSAKCSPADCSELIRKIERQSRWNERAKHINTAGRQVPQSDSC